MAGLSKSLSSKSVGAVTPSITRPAGCYRFSTKITQASIPMIDAGPPIISLSNVCRACRSSG